MTKVAETVRADKGARRPQGLIIYRGPSMLDGAPILAVATGLARKSKNPKTGASTVQTYIMADGGADPLEAARTGQDAAVCGDCPHRSHAGKLGSCYVNLGQAPLAVWRAAQAEAYHNFDETEHLPLFAGRLLRLGSYGDPAAVPFAVWELLCGAVASWTGYTHQWARCDQRLSRLCMASVDTPWQREEARRAGWRTFRVRLAAQPLLPGEFACPASEEAGKRLTCENCLACDGAKAGGRNASPAIILHGSTVGGSWKLRRFEEALERLETAQAWRIPLATV